MPEALVYFVAITLAIVMVITLDSKRSISVEGDEIVVSEFGRKKRLHRDEIKAAMLQIDALGSSVLVLLGSKPSTSVVVPMPRKVAGDSNLRRVVDLVRGTAERGVDIDPEILAL